MDSMTPEKWVATTIVVAILSFVIWEIIKKRNWWPNRLRRVQINQLGTLKRMLTDSANPEKGVLDELFKRNMTYHVIAMGLATEFNDSIYEMNGFAERNMKLEFEIARLRAMRAYLYLMRIRVDEVRARREEIKERLEKLKERKTHG